MGRGNGPAVILGEFGGAALTIPVVLKHGVARPAPLGKTLGPSWQFRRALVRPAAGHKAALSGTFCALTKRSATPPPIERGVDEAAQTGAPLKKTTTREAMPVSTTSSAIAERSLVNADAGVSRHQVLSSRLLRSEYRSAGPIAQSRQQAF
jgi:hypothetical protein